MPSHTYPMNMHYSSACLLSLPPLSPSPPSLPPCLSVTHRPGNVPHLHERADNVENGPLFISSIIS